MIGLFCLASCASYKNHLPENDHLYIGSKLKVVDSAIAERELLEETLSEALRPRTNKKIFGLRFKLGVYNTVGEPKSKKGIRSYLREKIGEPPVLGSDFNLNRNRQILINQLQNNGYFNPEINAERIVDSANKTIKGKFEVLAGKRKYFKSVAYLEEDTTQLGNEIKGLAGSSLIKKGNPYFLEAIIADRERIDNELKNRGYYFFSPDYLIASIDTGLNADSLDVKFTLKYDVIPPKVFNVYTIKDIFINPNYVVRTNTGDSISTRRGSNRDTVEYDYLKIIKRKNRDFQYKPEMFKSAIFTTPNHTYSRTVQTKSLSRLVSLNAFKFIKNDIVEAYDSTGRPLLSSIYLLTPYEFKFANLEIAGFSKDDNKVGSRLSISWKHRNLFKGAEQLEVKLSGGFEVQYGGALSSNPNLYQVGVDVNYHVPRMLFLKGLGLSTNSNYIPKSTLKAGYNYEFKQNNYRLNSLNFGFGYAWKEAANKDHKLFPLNITYVRTDTIDKTSDFKLSNILFNGIIIGPTYQFTFNSQVGGRNDLNFYFDGALDLSANILGLAQGAKIGEPQKRILGAAYAQYIKAQTDFRLYKSIGTKKLWANRLFLGAGYAYGNSTNMPNIKQFFSGGANSLRGFRSRRIGPGAFNQEGVPEDQQFLELLGDIKLEFNSEFRFPVYSDWIKGGVFVDAGNIWLMRERGDMPGSKFTSAFYKDIAASAGLGLRFDFSILVLRTDFGMPIRKPWVNSNGGFVFDQIDFSSSAWRRQNIIFNLAIGYPF